MKKYLVFSLLFLVVIVSGCSREQTNQNSIVNDSLTPVNPQKNEGSIIPPVQDNKIEATTSLQDVAVSDLATTAATDKIYTDKEKQISINFIDGYKKYNDYQIGFGSLGANLNSHPTTTDEKQSYHFQLDIKDYKSANNLITEYKVRNVKPVIININGFEAIKYAEGSICEDRVIEVIGKKYNYHFAADGCVNSKETDFNYLTQTIKQLRILE